MVGIKRMKDKELADFIALEVKMALEANKKSKMDYKVLAILTHLGRGIDKLSDALFRMASENLSVLIWTVPEIDNHLKLRMKGMAHPTMEVVVDQNGSFGLPDFSTIENIFFGAFGFEIADKIIQLKDDDPTVNILLQGILNDKSVQIITPFPIAKLNAFDYSPSSKLNQEIRHRIDLLSIIGFGFLDEKDLLDRYLNKESIIRDLITESYIEKLRNVSQEIRLTKSAIVTPLAIEKARDLQITITRI